MTRCRMPPENSCGKADARSRGVRNAGERQQLDGARVRRLARDVVVNEHRLGDLIADGVDRRERRQRVLKDHRDAPAADVGQLAIAQPDQLALAKADRSRDARVLRQQAHDRQRRHRLARPRFADNARAPRRRAPDTRRRAPPTRRRPRCGMSRRGCRPPGSAAMRCLERRLAHGALRPAACGSSASRSASPTRLIDSTSTTSDAAGK